MKKELSEFIDNTMRLVVAKGSAVGAPIGVGEHSTRQFAEENAPGFIVNEVDRVISKIRPQSNPLAVIATRVPSTKSNSQEFEFFEVDTLPDQTTVKTQHTGASNKSQIELDTNNNDIFSEKEVLIFIGVDGYDEEGTTQTPYVPLAGYVEGKTSDNKPIVTVINGKKHPTASGSFVFPDIPADTLVLRSARAHNEEDVQTPPFAVVPVLKTQYIQKFKCQVEESTANAIVDKKADITMSDQEEEAVFDMTRGISKAIILGAKRKKYDKKKKIVYFTGGLWGSIGRNFVYSKNKNIGKEELVELFGSCFIGSNGSKRKTCIAGSGVMKKLTLVDLGDQFVVSFTERFDLRFKTVETNFGTIDFIYDENMDAMGLSDCAMVLDEDLIRRKDYGGVTDEQELDFKKTGEKDAKGKVITRAFALYLKNPEAHLRIIPK